MKGAVQGFSRALSRIMGSLFLMGDVNYYGGSDICSIMYRYGGGCLVVCMGVVKE